MYVSLRSCKCAPHYSHADRGNEGSFIIGRRSLNFGGLFERGNRFLSVFFSEWLLGIYGKWSTVSYGLLCNILWKGKNLWHCGNRRWVSSQRNESKISLTLKVCIERFFANDMHI